MSTTPAEITQALMIFSAGNMIVVIFNVTGILFNWKPPSWPVMLMLWLLIEILLFWGVYA